MAKRNKYSAANRKYLRNIAGRFTSVPKMLAANTAALLYEYAILSTRFDSGQAAANWRIAAHDGSFTPESPDLMWGWGDMAPISPVGYKGSGGLSREAVIAYMMEQRIANADYLETLTFTHLTVYNPIEPGAFQNFQPGDDSKYRDIALGTWDDIYQTFETMAEVNAEKIVQAKLKERLG